ncbi:MAG: beta-ketoacyl synthase N-terminal-like domain-containing protein [Candidatus Omnitrophota bacterium]|jgi:hypothetical protein
MKLSITGISIKEKEDKINIEAIHGLVKAAFCDSRVKINSEYSRDLGFFIGTTFSNSDIRKSNTENYRKGGVRVVSPTDFPKCLISYLGGDLSTAFNLKGANSTLSSGVSSGVDAFVQAGYFVGRSGKNKAVIVELDEKVSQNLSCSLMGSACLIIENNSGAGKKRHSYADVLGIESFFEKEGENKGLIKALQAVLKKHALKISSVDYILGLSMPKTKEYILERDALQGFADPEKFISLPPNLQKINNGSGIGLIADLLKNADFGYGHNKKNILILFILLGKDTNSSCVAIKIQRKRRVVL